MQDHFVYDHENLNAKCYFGWNYELDGYTGIVVKDSKILISQDYDRDSDLFNIIKLFHRQLIFSDENILTKFSINNYNLQPVNFKFSNYFRAEKFNDYLLLFENEYKIIPLKKNDDRFLIISGASTLPKLESNWLYENLRKMLVKNSKKLQFEDLEYLNYLRINL